MTLQSITLRRPDDWHVHLRDGAMLEAVAPFTARQFARAIIMPNLAPPITSVAQAEAYRARIMAAAGPGFTPLMTAYLTNDSDADEIERGHRSGTWIAAKLYPAGATTNSDLGVTDLANCDAVFAAMEQHGVPLLLHGEVTDPAVDVFDREAIFIERHLIPLRKKFPALKIVLEHLTTQQGVEFVNAAPANVAATITAHHLLYNRNAMFQGGIRPHYFCLPVLKREQHRQALIAAATSGSPKFFLGTDSAPHPVGAKETACGCAGIYTAHAALELYAEVFDGAGKLDKLEGFASQFGADFYGLPRNSERVTLKREVWAVPATLTMGETKLVPLRAGESMAWRLVDEAE